MASSLAFASPRFGAFTLRTECPRCGAHLPANGPAPTVTCAACEERVEVPAKLVRELFDWFEEHWPDVKSSSAETLGDLTWRWTSEPSAGPRCVGCRAEIAVGDDSEDALTCGHCGDPLASAPVPRAMNEEVRSATRVYGADPDVLPAVIAAPVAMGCPQCGAGLTLTSEHQRLTPCGHCGTSIHIPDAVWRALHPPRTVHPWIVRFDGESRPARAARIAREKAEREREQAERKRQAREEADRKRREAEERRREAEQARAEAERARAEAERARREAAEKRRRILLLPLLAGSWIAGFGGALLLAGTAAWYTWGPLNVLVPLAPRQFWAEAPRPAMIAAFLVALFGWTLVHVGVALRCRYRVVAALQMAFFFGALVNVPMIGFVSGPIFALLYFTGGEPTSPSMKEKPPFAWRVPGAALALTFGFTWMASLGALLGVPVLGPGGMLERMLD